MNKLEIQVGDKFGDWVVLNPNVYSKNGHIYAQCQCKCGTIKDIATSALKRGKTSKCKSCSARSRTTILKIGDKYKHWTIIDGPIYKDNGNYHTAYYKVKCDCGKEQLKLPNDLLAKDRDFQCESCSQKENKEKLMKENGKVGDLNLTRYTTLKRSAEKRNIEFSVSLEYLWNLFKSQDQICAITGDYINSIDDASLDRIDSTKGYVEGNVQWVTKQANVSKHIMSMEELYEFCKKVLKHANQQLN